VQFNMDRIDLDAEIEAASKRSTSASAIVEPAPAASAPAITRASDAPSAPSYEPAEYSAPSYTEPSFSEPSYSTPSYSETSYGEPTAPAPSGQSSPVSTPEVTTPEFGPPPSEAPSTTESDSVAVAVPVAAEGKRWMTGALAGLVLLAVIEAVAVVILWNRPADTLTGDGELVVQSRPSAARVIIDRKERGTTPLTLKLSPGAHILEVQVGKSEPRVIPLQIRAGVQTAQYVELLSVPTTGVLEISSEPSRARVTVDGQDRGTTPVVVRELPPGDHQVVVKAGAREFKQTVRVEAGKTGQMQARLLP
jgi:PEGA domain